MTMQVGNKVKFLNEVGEGIVTKILSNNQVMVEGPDGFEIPMYTNELVLCPSSVKEKDIIKEEKTTLKEEKLPVTPRSKNIVETNIDDHGEKNLYFAFVPENEDDIIADNILLYFINDSSYSAYYTFSICNSRKEWVLQKKGEVNALSKELLISLSVGAVSDIVAYSIQVLLFKQVDSDLSNPYAFVFKNNPKKLCKNSLFQKNEFFTHKAFLCSLIKDNEVFKDNKIDTKKIELSMYPGASSINFYSHGEVHTVSNIDEPVQVKKHNDELVFDLHASELLDCVAGLSSKDILSYQLKKFNEIMQEHLKKKGRKLIFIHGKGDGVLRNQIIKELRTKYKKCYFQDASFREYGYGATMVTVK